MQAVNTEKAMTAGALPAQAKAAPKSSASGGGSFKDVVKKATDGKNKQSGHEIKNQARSHVKNKAPGGEALTAAPVSALEDAQVSGLAAMMTGSNMTVLPFDLAQQQTMQPQQEQPEQHPSAMPVQASAQSAGTAAPATQQPQKAANTAAPVANEALANPPPNENTAQKTPQQQVDRSGPSGETASKGQPQAEKQTAVKSGEVASKPAEAKPEAAKEAKPEYAGPVKTEFADQEKVFVKVGDGGKIDSGKFVSDISERLIAKMTGGTQQFEIKLEPQELGKILIKIVVQNGKAEITMQCMNPRTQQLVMANSDAIRNIVEERTGMHTSVTAKEGTEAYGNMDDRDNQNGHAGHGEQHGDKWDETETNIFLQQLRLGLTETTET